MEYKLKHYKAKKTKQAILGIDVGGTNTNIGIFSTNLKLLFSLHFKSKKLNSIIPAINETLNFTSDLKITKACIAAAGPVAKDICTPVNLPWKIKSKEILKKTSLTKVKLINDFQAIGYSINILKNKDLLTVRKGKKEKNKTIAVIGAGTGLGKNILIYKSKSYIPIPSEGGHSDFSPTNELELKLANFIKKKRKIKQINYEEVLSGRGILAIYFFLKKNKHHKPTAYTKEIAISKEPQIKISKYRKKDHLCRETFKLYTLFYARAAKNFVLETLSKSGLYIAGGIAAKNKDIFKTKTFLNEFDNVDKLNYILKKIPIKVITNYNAGMIGAAYAASLI